MFNSLFRKKKEFHGLLSHTDMHSHLLPQIDDGVQSLEESLDVITGFKNLGYKKLITTPHIMHDFYKNDVEIIMDKLSIVRKALQAQSIEMEIEAAAEYYLDEYFLELTKAKDELLCFGDRYVLFELPFMAKPLILNEVIFSLQTRGYKPILAHPERYQYFHQNIDELEDLVNKGVLLQLNLLSLSGYYSKEVKRMANTLIKSNLISFIGSDCHNSAQLMSLAEVLDSHLMNPLQELNLLNSKL